jgi:hypothetical protein
MVTNRVLKVGYPLSLLFRKTVNAGVQIDAGTLVKENRKSVLQQAVAPLADLVLEWSEEKGGSIEEIEWVKGKGHSLDLQDTLHERAGIERRLQAMTCVKCKDFDEHVSLSHLAWQSILD